jgi:hypothetical protein
MRETTAELEQWLQQSDAVAVCIRAARMFTFALS